MGYERPSGYDRAVGLFALAFALFVSHELDAMIRQEWQLLPGLNALDPSIATDVFNLIHVPLFTGVIWLLLAGPSSTRRKTTVVVEVLLLVHALAHFVLRGDERYNFEPPVETITVYGAALASLLHLSMLRRPAGRSLA